MKNIQTNLGGLLLLLFFGLYNPIFNTINFIYLKCFHVTPTWVESKIVVKIKIKSHAPMSLSLFKNLYLKKENNMSIRLV